MNPERAAMLVYAAARPARALFLMRGFYFLGILRGGEAYRASLLLNDNLNADERPTVPFELSESCTDLFVQDVQSKPSKTLWAIYRLLAKKRDYDKIGV